MENNLENKAKFFALYWGQKVFKWNDAPMKSKVGITHMTKHHLLNMHLELKSVSLITDEDAKTVINIYDGSCNKPHYNFISKKSPFNEVFRQVYYIHPSSCPTDDGYRVIANFCDNRVNVINSANKYEFHIQSIDFLRSKGYVLPFMGASVGELINMGWLKLKGAQDE